MPNFIMDQQIKDNIKIMCGVLRLTEGRIGNKFSYMRKIKNKFSFLQNKRTREQHSKTESSTPI